MPSLIGLRWLSLGLVIPGLLWLSAHLGKGAGACSPVPRTTYLLGASPGALRLDRTIPAPVAKRVEVLPVVEASGGCFDPCALSYDVEQEKLILEEFEGEVLYICANENPNNCLSSRWGVVAEEDGTYYAVMNSVIPELTREYEDGMFLGETSKTWLFAAFNDGRRSPGTLILVDDLRDASNPYCVTTCGN